MAILRNENRIVKLFGLNGFSRVSVSYRPIDDVVVAGLTRAADGAEFSVNLPHNYKAMSLAAFRDWVEYTAAGLQTPARHDPAGGRIMAILRNENMIVKLFGLNGFSRVSVSYRPIDDVVVAGLTRAADGAEFSVDLPHNYKAMSLAAFRDWVEYTAAGLQTPAQIAKLTERRMAFVSA